MTTIIACICTVIGTIITISMTIGKPLMENTKIMTQLTDAVKVLTDQFSKFESNNYEAHKRMHERLDEEAVKINDHETRIKILEQEVK